MGITLGYYYDLFRHLRLYASVKVRWTLRNPRTSLASWPLLFDGSETINGNDPLIQGLGFQVSGPVQTETINCRLWPVHGKDEACKHPTLYPAPKHELLNP